MKSFVTSVNNISNPIGFDLEIDTIQSKLAELGWIEFIFGVAHVQKRTKSEEESLTSFKEGYRGTERYNLLYPQGRKYGTLGDAIDVDLSFDDSYASRIFFIVTDKDNLNAKVDPWNWTVPSLGISKPFSLILHCNLNSLEQQSSERLKTDILTALNNCPKIIATEIFEDMDKVWSEFTITPELNGITRYPNYCLRVNLICNYLAKPYNVPFGTPNNPVQIGWRVCKVLCNVVSSPDPSNVQVLANGVTIPIEYSLNLDNTVTIPYLNIVSASVLSRFLLNGQYYEGNFYINGNIDTTIAGSLGLGDQLEFDASLPIYSL